MNTGDLVEYDGIRLDVSEIRIGDELREAFSAGWYERHEAELVRNYLPPSFDVIELGAGIGYVSAIVSEILLNDAVHIAVEPNPRLSTVLQRTKELNDARYVVCERAYSSTPEPVELTRHKEYWDATTRPLRAGATEVRSTDLHGVCDRHDISEFSLVVDIEGAEYELFSAELDLLEARCPLLVVEFHEDGPYAAAYDDLEDSAFELVDGLETVCVYRNTRFQEDTETYTKH